MSNFKRYGKVVLFDSLAGLCFVGVILFGWLPGPGGIPLLLLGLGLLAVNHEWAEHWLNTAKHKGVSLKKWLFPDIGWIKYGYDIACVLAVIFGFYLIYGLQNRLFDAVGSVLMLSALFIFFLNRDRYDKLSAALSKRKHK